MAKRSSQKFIARNRAPRVQIDYSVELYGAEKRIVVPFVVGVFADLAGSSRDSLSTLEDRRFVDIDVDNFDARMSWIEPRVTFTIPSPKPEDEQLNIDIRFHSLDDFSPAAIARKIPALNDLLHQRTLLSSLHAFVDGKAGAEEIIDRIADDESFRSSIVSLASVSASDDDEPLSTDEFGALLEKEFKPRSDRAREQVEEAVQVLAARVQTDLAAGVAASPDLILGIIDEIDAVLSKHLDMVLHHQDLRQLEGAWRGLHFLVANTESDELLKIRFICLSKREFGRTIKRYKGVAWQHSPIFKKIYDEQYSQLGGEPFGCLIGDYEFDHSPPDVEILHGMSMISAAAHAPFIAAVAPSVMQLESWQDIAKPRDLTKVFETVEYAAWRALRESEDSKFIALTMPRFLGRLPYGNETDPVEEFAYEESHSGAAPDTYVWCNSAYAMGTNITRAFKEYGWCARIRGIESGGLVEGLPAMAFPSDDGSVSPRSPTEVAITDRWEAELAAKGIMTLLHRKGSDFAAFIGAQSFHKLADYDDPDITAAASLAARLPYLLASCRFVQYLKCIVRDQVGSFYNREQMERHLNEWVGQYVDHDPASSSEESKARRPLADAQLVIEDIEGDPANYQAKFYLRPHFQLEGLTTTLRFMTTLPAEHSA